MRACRRARSPGESGACQEADQPHVSEAASRGPHGRSYGGAGVGVILDLLELLDGARAYFDGDYEKALAVLAKAASLKGRAAAQPLRGCCPATAF